MVKWKGKKWQNANDVPSSCYLKSKLDTLNYRQTTFVAITLTSQLAEGSAWVSTLFLLLERPTSYSRFRFQESGSVGNFGTFIYIIYREIWIEDSNRRRYFFFNGFFLDMLKGHAIAIDYLHIFSSWPLLYGSIVDLVETKNFVGGCD